MYMNLWNFGRYIRNMGDGVFVYEFVEFWVVYNEGGGGGFCI